MAQDLAMREFNECLFNLELTDVSFMGPIFTWMNRQEGENFIARKLDRCLQNEWCGFISQCTSGSSAPWDIRSLPSGHELEYIVRFLSTGKNFPLNFLISGQSTLLFLR